MVYYWLIAIATVSFILFMIAHHEISTNIQRINDLGDKVYDLRGL